MEYTGSYYHGETNNGRYALYRIDNYKIRLPNSRRSETNTVFTGMDVLVQ